MSLESTWEKLADSNLKLAASMDRYAGVMEAIANGGPQNIVVAGATGADAGAAATGEKAATGKAKPGPKPKDKAAPADADDGLGNDEDDGLGGGGESEKTYTADDVRKTLVAIKTAHGKDATDAILKHVGVTSLGQVEAKDYGKLMKFANSKYPQ